MDALGVQSGVHHELVDARRRVAERVRLVVRRSALPVIVFSTAGLALPAAGPGAGRTVANALATSLAGQMLEAATGRQVVHDRGPKSCPFYFNQERSDTNITPRLRFDKTCRGRLVKALGGGAARAFEAMLATYGDEAYDGYYDA